MTRPVSCAAIYHLVEVYLMKSANRTVFSTVSRTYSPSISVVTRTADFVNQLKSSCVTNLFIIDKINDFQSLQFTNKTAAFNKVYKLVVSSWKLSLCIIICICTALQNKLHHFIVCRTALLGTALSGKKLQVIFIRYSQFTVAKQ